MGQLLYLHAGRATVCVITQSGTKRGRRRGRRRARGTAWRNGRCLKKKQRREEEKKGDDLKAWRREVRVALRGQRALLELSSAAPTVSLAPSHLCAFPLSLSSHVVLSWSLSGSPSHRCVQRSGEGRVRSVPLLFFPCSCFSSAFNIFLC